MESSYYFTDPKVTIIVPIHNSEKYLEECLSTALAQTLKDIEILCIDSSSTDLCFEIIYELQQKDDRILYIKDPNTSYGHKINVGIESARGEYIGILETDDLMFPDMLRVMYSIAEEYHPDIVDTDYLFFLSYKEKQLYEVRRHRSDPSVYGHLIEDNSPKPTEKSAIWAALYRKEFLLEQEIRLNESPGASYQDVPFLMLAHFLAKTVYHLDVPLYQYRLDNAGSSVKDDKKVFEVAVEAEFFRKELEKRNIKDSRMWELYYSYKYSTFYWNYCRLSEKSRELFLVKYLDELRADIISGAITKEMLGTVIQYKETYLALDNLTQFKELAAEGDHYKPIEALGETLDQIGGRGLVMFGIDGLGRRILGLLQQNGNSILGICDNSLELQGTVVNGIAVCPVVETVKKYPDACYLIVSRRHNEEMKKQLLAEGVAETNIEIFA